MFIYYIVIMNSIMRRITMYHFIHTGKFTGKISKSMQGIRFLDLFIIYVSGQNYQKIYHVGACSDIQMYASFITFLRQRFKYFNGWLLFIAVNRAEGRRSIKYYPHDSYCLCFVVLRILFLLLDIFV